MDLRYVCDNARHLVCLPYSVENLHEMARDLGIKRCWFHASSAFPHYDIPKRRIAEITGRCTLVSSRDILSIVKGHVPSYCRERVPQPISEVLDGHQKNPESPDSGS